ncbi:MAG: hypothetical protein WD073_07160 [Xanthobacteraceae bacterium]
MAGRLYKQPSGAKKLKLAPQEKKHLDELLEEALEETFPASDPPAMLEPAPDLHESGESGNK